MIVADVNLVAYLLVEGDMTLLAEQVLAKDSNWVAPALWRSEFRNILMLYVRKNAISMVNAKRLMVQADYRMTDAEISDSGKILELALLYKLSAYDAEYLAVAQDYDIALITNDKKMVQNCPEALSIQEFISVSS